MRFDDLQDKRRRLDLFLTQQRRLDGPGECYVSRPRPVEVPDTWPEWAKDIARRHQSSTPVDVQINGIKPRDAYRYEAELCVLLLAQLKDHAKETLRERGRTRREADAAVEGAINASAVLSLCVDLANTDKHSLLRSEPRSGTRPRYAQHVQVSIPGHAFAKLELSRSGWSLDVAQSEEADFVLAVLDEDGEEIAEVGQLIADAVSAWDSLMHELGLGMDVPAHATNSSG